MEPALIALMLLFFAALIDKEAIFLFAFTIVAMCIILVLGVTLCSLVYCLSQQPFSIQISVCILMLSIVSAIFKRIGYD